MLINHARIEVFTKHNAYALDQAIRFFSVLLCITLSAMSHRPIDGAAVYSFPHQDKVIHTLIYGLIALRHGCAGLCGLKHSKLRRSGPSG